MWCISKIINHQYDGPYEYWLHTCLCKSVLVWGRHTNFQNFGYYSLNFQYTNDGRVKCVLLVIEYYSSQVLIFNESKKAIF